MIWSYGVTTVPQRAGDLLPRTLASLAAAGFGEPHLFVDGATGIEGYPAATVRWPPVLTAGNWTLALWELYIRESAADRYAVFQDDFVTYRNLRAYLEWCRYPEKGYWNLYTFSVNERIVIGRPVGWHVAGASDDGWQYGRGAVALVFNRDAVVALLKSEHLANRFQDLARGWRNIDGGIVTAMNKADYQEYVHNPSLVQHLGTESAMGNYRQLQAASFRGEDFDAMDLLKEPCSSETQ